MEIFNNVLSVINNVIISVVGFAFTFQIIYLFLFFLPKRKYPQAKTKHKVGIIISAKDEADCIGQTIEHLLKLDYPKDKFEIMVVADNCSDNTAEIVRSYDGKEGVRVRAFERQEPDKKKHNVGYALNFLFDKLMPEIDNFEFFVRFDADAIVDRDYLNQMNNAFESGVKVARAYNHASNLTQNIISGVSGMWYIRDSRFNCHARAALHTDAFLVGSGMMFSAEVIKEDGGWKAFSKSEDIDFTILNMDKKRKIGYVPDAVLYEDQPSTIKDLFNRNVRMGNGLNKLFWQKGVACLFKFFGTFRYCYLDMFLNLLFIPIAVLCCTWFPAYYIYIVLFNFLSPLGSAAVALETLKFIGIILLCAFIVPFILQALLVYALDKKKIGQPFKKVAPAIFAFPLFMIIYALGIVWGVFTTGKWRKVKRNTEFVKSEKG